MRLTKHRQEILDVLKKHHGTMTAGDIHYSLPHINLVTIYRNLESFAEAGVIKKLYLADGEARFEYQEHPHYHAVCDSCHKVIHFEANEKSLRLLSTVPNFSINSIELTVHGHCTEHSNYYPTDSTAKTKSPSLKGTKAQKRQS